MSVQELQTAVRAVPGISVADVEPRDANGPLVRVWLDGSRDADEVAADVRLILGQHGYATRESILRDADGSAEEDDGASRPPNQRRSGLGRGLDSLIPASAEEEPPAHLQVAPPLQVSPEPPRLELVATEETADGVAVRAADSHGRAAISPMSRDDELHPAITAAVGGLFGEPNPPRLIGFETHEVGEVSVLTCVIETAKGDIATGSAVAAAGLPFTLGKAVWAALESLR
jgi:hypothetical protein